MLKTHKYITSTSIIALLLVAGAALSCTSSTASPSVTPAISPAGFASPTAAPTRNPLDDAYFFDNFKTAEAKARDLDYALYWLGPEFTVGEVVSKGPFVAGPFLDDVPGIVEVRYHRDGPLTTTSREARLTLFEDSPAEWQRVKASLAGPVGRAVLIAGMQAQFYSLPDPNTKTTTLRAVIDFGTTVVVAEARTLIGAGGADLNLLTDEQTFLSVLQNLRPYPQ